MAVSIDALVDIAKAALESVVPDFTPSITFREAYGDLPLANQEALGSIAETTRTFHILEGFDPELSEVWVEGPDQPYWAQTLEVQVRYQVPLVDGGWLRVRRFVGVDAPQILQALYQADYGGTSISRVVDVRASSNTLELINPEESIWLLTMTPRIHYTRG